MSFLSCPYCGKPVSDTWASCISCGLSMKKIKRLKAKTANEQKKNAKNFAKTAKSAKSAKSEHKHNENAGITVVYSQFSHTPRHDPPPVYCHRCVHLRNETCSGLNGPCSKYLESIDW